MRDRLSDALAAVQTPLYRIEVPGLRAEDVPLLEVTAALVRGVYQQCQSVLALADAHSWSGLGAVERAAWEMWNELEFVLRSENPSHAAAKVQANAVLGVVSLLENTDDVPAGMLERNRELLERLEKRHRAACDEVREQRKARKWHWSGQPRTSVVGPTDASKKVYKLLSWETHPDMASLREVEVTFDGNVAHLKFGDEEGGTGAIDRSCRSAAEMLLRSWNLLAQYWRLPPVTGVPGWTLDA